MRWNDTRWLMIATVLLGSAACGDDENIEEEAGEEVITTVTLTFDANDSDEVVAATFRDADGQDGGEPPTQFDPIVLTNGTSYTLTIDLLNETVDPADPEYQIGDEIAEEAEEHQFFFTGDAVGGPANPLNPSNPNALVTVTYDDVESDYADGATDPDLPVGLQNQVVAVTAGGPVSGGFVVTLKHQPPLNEGEPPQKSPTSGLDTGGTDVQIAFDLTVQ